MKYQQGSFGRVFLLAFEDGDNLREEIELFVKKEHIRAATVALLGGIRSADVVTGPKEPVVPPEPSWQRVDDGREVIGFGTIFWHEDAPVLHLHGSLGRGDSTITGCIRKNSIVYLVIEAVITEIVGVRASKTLDVKTGLVLLDL